MCNCSSSSGRRTASGSFSRVASFSDRSISSAAACSVVPMTRSRSACKNGSSDHIDQVLKAHSVCVNLIDSLRMSAQLSTPGSASAKRGERYECAAPRLRAFQVVARLSAAAQSPARPTLQPHQRSIRECIWVSDPAWPKTHSSQAASQVARQKWRKYRRLRTHWRRQARLRC
jgi:hypothetical protein